MTNNESDIIRVNRANYGEYRKILASAQAGGLIKLRNGLYAKPEALMGDTIDIETIVPGGILCLYSAWRYYNLTTQVPGAYYVAVERSRKLRLPQFPTIKPVFQRAKLLEIGKAIIEIEDKKIAMTDIERSVCDAIKYRNKIGIDVMVEIIDSYLQMPGKDLSRLSRYARLMRIYSTLQQILQIKL